MSGPRRYGGDGRSNVGNPDGGAWRPTAENRQQGWPSAPSYEQTAAPLDYQQYGYNYPGYGQFGGGYGGGSDGVWYGNAWYGQQNDRWGAPQPHPGPRGPTRYESQPGSQGGSGSRGPRSSRQYHSSSARNDEPRGDSDYRSADPVTEPYEPMHMSATVPTVLPPIPDNWYLKSTLQKPETFPTELARPKPLPLLVLDLNGTLVNRPSRDAERSKRPTLRPYLSNFLEYCLALHVEQENLQERTKQWAQWDTERAARIPEDESAAEEDESASRDSPPRALHGTHFWPGKEEPKALSDARFRLLVWSSAQPHNVDSMARAFLPPIQAEHLLRVYARDTLVIKSLYKLKAPSVKDLEVIWATLNHADGARMRLLRKAEDRIFAEERQQQDLGYGKKQYRKLSLRLWKAGMEMSRLDPITGQFIDGKGYGAHNTLLLDDSLDKARLQPYNHILLPEFDSTLAKAAVRYRHFQERQGDVGEGEGESPKEPEMPEDILLQTVGVLEHARNYVNIACWIRFGGLGNFGEMAHRHPGRTLNEKKWQEMNFGLDSSARLDSVAATELKREWNEYFSLPDDAEDEGEGPRLRTRLSLRTPAFWAEEGRRALRKAGIEPVMFM